MALIKLSRLLFLYLVETYERNHSNIVYLNERMMSRLDQIYPSFLGEKFLCRNRCGAQSELADEGGMNTDDLVYSCSCDAHCLIYKDCCEDVARSCPAVVDEALSKYAYHLHVKVDCSRLSNRLVISSCPNKSVGDDVDFDESVIQDLVDNAHVTDRYTGLLYANRFVYDCHKNNENDAVTWNVSLKHANSRPLNDSLTVKNFTYRQPRYEAPHFLRVSSQGRACEPRSVDTCNATLETQELCASFTSYVSFGYTVYRNRACAACHDPGHRNLSFINIQLPVLERNELLLTKYDVIFRRKHHESDSWWLLGCPFFNRYNLSNVPCAIIPSVSDRREINYPEDISLIFTIYLTIPLDVSSLNRDQQRFLLLYISLYLKCERRFNVTGAVEPVLTKKLYLLNRHFSLVALVVALPLHDYGTTELNELPFVSRLFYNLQAGSFRKKLAAARESGISNMTRHFQNSTVVKNIAVYKACNAESLFVSAIRHTGELDDDGGGGQQVNCVSLYGRFKYGRDCLDLANVPTMYCVPYNVSHLQDQFRHNDTVCQALMENSVADENVLSAMNFLVLSVTELILWCLV